MKRRMLVFEAIVATVTLLAAGAFAHASVNGQSPLFTAVEAKAEVLGRKMFRDECITCHVDGAAAPRPVREATTP